MVYFSIIYEDFQGHVWNGVRQLSERNSTLKLCLPQLYRSFANFHHKPPELFLECVYYSKKTNKRPGYHSHYSKQAVDWKV